MLIGHPLKQRSYRYRVKVVNCYHLYQLIKQTGKSLDCANQNNHNSITIAEYFETVEFSLCISRETIKSSMPRQYASILP
jgi:hypothetical protein